MTRKSATNCEKVKMYKIVDSLNNECFTGGKVEDLTIKIYQLYKIIE